MENDATVGWIAAIIIGGIAGWLAEQFMKSNMGMLMNIALGIIGAIVNDWTLTGIVTLQSGIPLAIAQTTNNNAFAGFGTQRPNLVGDPDLPSDERSGSYPGPRRHTSRNTSWWTSSAVAGSPSAPRR